MWSYGSVFEGANDGSGFTLSAFRARLKVDLSRLQAAQMKLMPFGVAELGLNGMAKSDDAIAVLCYIDIECDSTIPRSPKKFGARGENPDVQPIDLTSGSELRALLPLLRTLARISQDEMDLYP